MSDRSRDWLRQAHRDLDSARAQKQDGFFEWACFIAQQASEKALKALLQARGHELWGHSLIKMVGILKTDIAETAHIEASARVLDRFYIPARYPNGWAEGIPADYISEEDACNALSHSEKIIRFCDSLLA